MSDPRRPEDEPWPLTEATDEAVGESSPMPPVASSPMPPVAGADQPPIVGPIAATPDDTSYLPAYASPPADTPPQGYPQQPAYQAVPPAPAYPPPFQQDATVAQPIAQPPAYQQPPYQQPVYQQPTYQQQPPAYPPGYQYPQGYPPPAYGQQWAPPAEYRYGSNILVNLGALWLLVAGLVVTLVGVLLLVGGQLLRQAGVDPLTAVIRDSLTIVAAIVAVFGILHLLSAIFIWAHRSWARFVGILLSLLGVVAGLGLVVATVSRVRLPDGTVIGPTGSAETAALIVNGAPLALYAVTFLALLFGSGHFERRRVQ